MRSRGAMRDQTPERNALRAALTAASTSLASLRATSQMTELSTGLMDSKRRPFLASTNLPSMKLRVSGFNLAATLCQPLRSKALAWSRFMASSTSLSETSGPCRLRQLNDRYVCGIGTFSIAPALHCRLARLRPAHPFPMDHIEAAGGDDDPAGKR